MDPLTYINNSNPAYIDSLYQQFLTDPTSLDEKLHSFFAYQLVTQLTDLMPLLFF